MKPNANHCEVRNLNLQWKASNNVLAYSYILLVVQLTWSTEWNKQNKAWFLYATINRIPLSIQYHGWLNCRLSFQWEGGNAYRRLRVKECGKCLWKHPGETSTLHVVIPSIPRFIKFEYHVLEGLGKNNLVSLPEYFREKLWKLSCWI